jgi:hypothetical protein
VYAERNHADSRPCYKSLPYHTPDRQKLDFKNEEQALSVRGCENICQAGSLPIADRCGLELELIPHFSVLYHLISFKLAFQGTDIPLEILFI